MITLFIIMAVLSVWVVVGAVFCLLGGVTKVPKWLAYLILGPTFWIVNGVMSFIED